MNEQEVRQKCEAFLQSLGVPCFLVFGWKKDDTKDGKSGKAQSKFGVISSYHKMPRAALVKGMTWALHDTVDKTM